MKQLHASTFKATCLAVMDEVAETGATYTITKRGKAVAQIVPPAPASKSYPQLALQSSFEILGDIVAPTTHPDDWDSNRR